MEEKPQAHTPQEIVSVEAIQNLDTARMALRWALERMQKLEQEKSALADTAAAAERARSRAQDEYAAIQKTLSLRSAEGDQRELYYAKMEEFLSVHLGGKMDLAALGKRELEVQKLQELLAQKQVQLDKELAAKRAALEREVHGLKTDLEAAARSKSRELEQAFELKRSALEADYLSRMANVHEKEILHKQEAQALAERQEHFEEYYATQRAQLQTQIKNFKAEVEDQTQFRLKMAEKIADERHAGLQEAWHQERLLLARELESWRTKAQELGPRALDLEKSLALAEERARQAQSAADRQTLLCEESRRIAQAAQATAQEDARRAVAADEALQQARRALELQAAAVEERRLGWDEEKNIILAELAESKDKLADSQDAGADLEKRLALAEDSLRQAQAQVKQSAERLTANRKDSQSESAWAGQREQALLGERDALKAALARAEEQVKVQAAEQDARRLNVEKKLALAEDSLRLAQAQAQQASERLLERQKAEEALLAERASLKAALGPALEEAKAQSAELAELRSRLTAVQLNADESSAHAKARISHSEQRRLDLEERLALAEDSLRQAQAEARRLTELNAAAQAENAETVLREQDLLKERAALAANLARAQEEAKARAAQLNELQTRLPALQKNWDQAQAEARAHLLHSDEQDARRLELQKKLAITEDSLRQAQAEARRLTELNAAAQAENASAARREQDLIEERAALASNFAQAQGEAKAQAAQLMELQSRLPALQKNWDQAQAEAKAHLLHSAEQEARRQELEKKLALTEDSLRESRALAQQAADRLADGQKTAQAEQDALASEIASLRKRLEASVAAGRENARKAEAADEVRQRLIEAEGTLAHAEDTLTKTEDSLRESRALAQQAAERLAERQRSAQAEGVSAAQREQALLDELSALKSELARAKAEAHADAAQLAELQTRMPVLEQNWEQARAGVTNLEQNLQAQTVQRLELEKQLALAEDSLRESRARAQQAAERLAESQKTALAESLSAEEREKALMQERAALRADLARAQDARGALESQAAANEQRRQGWEEEKKALLAELSEWKDKLAKNQDAAAALEGRLSHAESATKRAQVELATARQDAHRALELQAATIEERRRLVWEEERKILLAELSEWEGKLAEARDQAAQLAKGRSLAEADAKLKETELQTVRAQRAKLEAELAAVRQREQEGLSRLLALERGLTNAEEAENAMARHLTRFEQQKSAWEQERAQLQEELAQHREQAAGALPKLLDLERRLALTEEALKQARASAAQQAASLQEDARKAAEQQRLGWETERKSLLAELGQWQDKYAASQAPAEQNHIVRLEAELAAARQRSQEDLPRLIELEKAVAAAKDAAKQAEARAQAEQAQRVGFEAELDAARDQLRRAASSAEAMHRARAAADRRAAEVEERRQGWEAEKRALLAELGQWRDKHAESQTQAGAQQRVRLEAELAATRERADETSRRLLELEKAFAVAKMAAEQAEALAEAGQRERANLAGALVAARDEARKDWEDQKKPLLAELDRLRESLVASQRKVGELSAREGVSAQRAEAQIQAVKEERAAIEAAWVQDKKLLIRELESARAKAQEWGPKMSGLEKAAGLAEERARQAQAATDRLSAILEEHRLGAQAELTALQIEAHQWKEKSAEHLAELLEFKKKAGVLEEGLRQMQALSESQAARFDERNHAWDRERADLLAQINRLKPKT